MARRTERRAAGEEYSDPHDRVDEECRATHRKACGADRDLDAFGRFRANDRVDRGIQARTTTVSAM